MQKLNLGCGSDIREGYVNLDIIKREGVDVVHDLNKKLPFKDNTFEVVYSSHVLEHVDDVLNLLEEIYRILKPGGVLKSNVPYYSSAGAFQDPTHKHFFADDTLKHYIVTNAYEKKFKYTLLTQKLYYTLPFKYLIGIRSIARYFLLNVVHQIYFELRAEK